MTYSGRSLPQVVPSGVSAHFVDQDAANAATRALQRGLGIPTEAVGVALEPGIDAGEAAGEDAYAGLTKGGHVIVNVSVSDEQVAERVRAVLVEAGGALVSEKLASPSVGGYG